MEKSDIIKRDKERRRKQWEEQRKKEIEEEWKILDEKLSNRIDVAGDWTFSCTNDAMRHLDYAANKVASTQPQGLASSILYGGTMLAGMVVISAITLVFAAAVCAVNVAQTIIENPNMKNT